MKLLISEVLQKVSNAKTKAQKVKILQENNTNALRSLLIVNFDESVVSLLPEERFLMTPTTLLRAQSTLSWRKSIVNYTSSSKEVVVPTTITAGESIHPDA